MAEKNEFPKVVLKRKNIQTMIDFCLDESIEFAVRQQNFPDTDWEVEVKVSDVKIAIVLGMFLRENKFELAGVDSAQKIKKAVPAPKKSKDEEKAENGLSFGSVSTDSDIETTPTAGLL